MCVEGQVGGREEGRTCSALMGTASASVSPYLILTKHFKRCRRRKKKRCRRKRNRWINEVEDVLEFPLKRK